MTPPDRAAVGCYGPPGFITALTTIAVVETATWVWLPYWMANLFFFAVVSVPVLVAGLFFGQLPGATSQVGRGMLIGWLATPLTAAVTVIPITAVHLVLVHLG